MFRLLLPPNLAAAAERDAVAVKLELDLSQAPKAEWLPALAMLQRWSASPVPPPFFQLKRSQLRELIKSLERQPVFFWVNAPTVPLAWEGARLVGVPELSEPASVTPPPGRVDQLRASAARLARTAAAGTPANIDGSSQFLSVALPSKEHPSYAPLLELLKSAGFLLEPSNRRWWLRDRHKALNFLAEHGARLREEWGAAFTENFKRNTANMRPAEIVCSAEEGRGGYSLTMALRAGQADAEQVRAALAANAGYVEDRGSIYLIDSSKVRKLAEAQKVLAGDANAGVSAARTFRVSSLQVAEAQAVIEELSPNFQAPETWKKRSEALRNTDSLAPAPMNAALSATLRPYQRLGVAWLWFLSEQRLGGILADEMGLGKTLQALGLLSALAARGVSKPCLIVAPASLLENWRREAARFAPELNLFVHHADNRLGDADEFSRWNAVVTSYGTLVRDRALFEKVEFRSVLADEAQHIKNRRSQNAQALRSLTAESRFLLTGTPLENSLDDLRSLFDFLLPGYLAPVPPGLRGDERQWYDERLLARTASYILRRTKRSVAPELPDKIEQVSWCEMTPAQAALYRRTQESCERELLDLESGGASEARLRFAMLTQLLRLRQICCDPRLVAGADAAKEEDSAKLSLLHELLDEALDDGHRVLIFSQFTSALALIREKLEADGVGVCYLDGSMSAKARQAEVDRFQKDASVPVFLLSLKAGGTGLNLTGADTVVHFDPWWNPAAEAQATDRAHRIGQQRTVTSYRLVCSSSVEEKVLALQEEKRALLADVFEASDAAASKLTLSDLKDLLTGR